MGYLGGAIGFLGMAIIYSGISCARIDVVPAILDVPPEEVVKVDGYYLTRDDADFLQSRGLLEEDYLRRIDLDGNRIITNGELRNLGA